MGWWSKLFIKTYVADFVWIFRPFCDIKFEGTKHQSFLPASGKSAGQGSVVGEWRMAQRGRRWGWRRWGGDRVRESYPSSLWLTTRWRSDWPFYLQEKECDGPLSRVCHRQKLQKRDYCNEGARITMSLFRSSRNICYIINIARIAKLHYLKSEL